MTNKAIVTSAKLTAIGDAIRSMNNSTDKYTPDEMATAIKAIQTGITPTGTITITKNGTTDVTNYASAVVNVPQASSVLDQAVLA